MDHLSIIARQTNAFQALEIAVPKLLDEAFSQNQLNQIKELGYACVCLLIRMDRFLVSEFAVDSLIQRKLNEEFPKHRIERKQFIQIQKAMLKPSNAIRIHQAHRILKKKNTVISNAVISSPVQPVFEKLAELEKFINLNWQQYLIAWLRTRRLSLRRRGASAKQKSIFTVLEYSGRIAAELTLPRPKKVTQGIRDELLRFIQPGDFFITRHNHAVTNLFLPGYWPHAALYVGENNSHEQVQWTEKYSTFEALKDGVHFRALEQTLNVDAFVVIRPNFSAEDKQMAIERVIQHAGKGYNFDFDFFRSDRLVCTEIIYRAYDGLNNKSIPLKERMGQQTLSAEDLLDLSLDTNWADPIAIYGVGKSDGVLVTGSHVNIILENSYRH